MEYMEPKGSNRWGSNSMVNKALFETHQQQWQYAEHILELDKLIGAKDQNGSV